MSKIITLPGLIDVHTHLREPGATQKEDFETGSKAAIAGGYTAILDMPNNPIPTVSEEALNQKINLAKGRIYSDLGFNFGAAANNYKIFPKIKNKVFGLKVYMNHTTGDLLMEDEGALEDVFKNWPYGKPILVHAEGETLKKAINLAKKYNQKLHVCHISLKQEIEFIKQTKGEGLSISCEISCHHLFLTDKDVQRLGPYGMMRPPLSSEEDRQALWDNLNTIDMIASDHAPHTKEEKNNPEKVVNGVPGLETTLPLLLTAFHEGKITIDQIKKMCFENPARIFNIPTDPQTFIEVDLNSEYEIKNENLYTKCGWTPFAGKKVKGKIKAVTLRGQIVYDGKNILRSVGRVIYPTNSR